MAYVKVITCMAMMICMMLISSPMVVNAISCSEVIEEIEPCLEYLRGGSSAPSRECCDGVNRLNHIADTTSARRTTCECLKSAAYSISDLNTNHAEELPRRCGVKLPYRISTSTDCNRIRA
ncbi:non-specific lipid-transfer protein 4-like [Cicer arietinum]|uniref:Non-specific lipid-transfer protein n=1 Tax=Cicer arietinum TaxID=3827 RepID=A0A1S2XNJ7_CICAR|nr:non-specific lipid-transfer protein 4-like [Cicer arietinum]